MDKHIIAIGGGGFGRSTGDLRIENYIKELSNKTRPNICFIPTATGDNDSYKLSFYRAFSKIECNPSHIDFFKRTIDIEGHVRNQDIIYVGGGNTKSMLAVWKEWGLDLILKKEYNNGLILSGVSAGAICWFTTGITDSYQNKLAFLNCLDLVKGVCCPHYDEEKERAPFVQKSIKNEIISSCIAIEGYCALHIRNGKPYKSINFGENKSSYLLYLNKNKVETKHYRKEFLPLYDN